MTDEMIAFPKLDSSSVRAAEGIMRDRLKDLLSTGGIISANGKTYVPGEQVPNLDSTRFEVYQILRNSLIKIFPGLKEYDLVGGSKRADGSNDATAYYVVASGLFKDFNIRTATHPRATPWAISHFFKALDNLYLVGMCHTLKISQRSRSELNQQLGQQGIVEVRTGRSVAKEVIRELKIESES